MTRQEMFDKAYKGLAAQNFVASMKGEYGNCAYRGENGRKCAIGHLIDDETASRMEPYGAIGSYFYFQAEMESDIPFDEDDEQFLVDLQNAHDRSTMKDTYGKTVQEGLADVAQKYNLTVPEV